MDKTFKATLALLLSLLLLPTLASSSTPSINSVSHAPSFTDLNGTILITTNVTGTDLDKVVLRTTMDDTVVEYYPMNNTSTDIYEYVFDPVVAGTYDYVIIANDTSGLSATSTIPRTFYIFNYINMKMDVVIISVEISSTCCGIITYFYVPEIVIQNQTVVFLLFFSNCGNTNIDNNNLIQIKNNTGQVVASMSGASIPSGPLAPSEENFFYNFWSTVGFPTGNYTARANISFTSTLSSSYNVSFNFNTLNNSATCSPKDARNHTYCTKLNLSSCDNIIQSTSHDIPTASLSSATVPDMWPSSVAFEGEAELDGITYHAYTFNMTNHTMYDYACLSRDTTIEPATECTYVNGQLTDPPYLLSAVDKDGQSISLKRVETICKYLLTTYNCTVSGGNALCDVNEYCYGNSIMEKPFQIVTSLGRNPENITTNITIYVPQLEPWIGAHLYTFREMPHIIGQTEACDRGDPWADCTKSRIKLILYNAGIKNATNIRTRDNSVKNYCAEGDCYFEDYWCVPSPDYYCMECKSAFTISNLNASYTGVGNLYTLFGRVSSISKIESVYFQIYRNSTGWLSYAPDSINTIGITNEYSYLYTAPDSSDTFFRLKITDKSKRETYSGMLPVIEHASSNAASAPNITSMMLYYNRNRQKLTFRVNVSDADDDLTYLSIEYWPANSSRSQSYGMYEVATPVTIFQFIIRIFAPGEPRTYEQIVNTTLGGNQYYRITARDALLNTVYSEIGSFNDTCVNVGDNVSGVEFVVNNSLPPQGYVILEYEAVPTINKSSYVTAVNRSYYTYLSYTTFYPDNAVLGIPNYSAGDIINIAPNDTGFIMYENRSDYNPPKSRTLTLRNYTAFDYNIDSIPNTMKIERYFNQNMNTSFILTIWPLSIAGAAQTSEQWEAKMSIPLSWQVSACNQLSGPSCNCSFNNSQGWLMCESDTTPALFDNITLELDAIASTKDIFLLPINKSITLGLSPTYDEFYPGLFLTSKEINPLNISQNVTQNITQNVTQPEPQPQPQPQPLPIPIPQPQPQPQPQEKEVQKEVPREVEKNITLNITVPKEGAGPEAGLTQISVHIEPYERNIAGEQGVFIPMVFKVVNLGEVAVDNITLVPLVPAGWEARNALIDLLEINQTLNRTIFVKPPYSAHGVYVIPVKAMRENSMLDMDYVMLTVLEASDRTKIRLEEVPRKVIITSGSTLDVPILVKNTGRVSLHDITLRIENDEQCLSLFTWDKIYVLNVNESKSVVLHMTAKDVSGQCNTILILGTKEDAYAFSDMQIVVTPPSALIPLLKRPTWILTLIAVVLIALLIVRDVKKRVDRITKMVK